MRPDKELAAKHGVPPAFRRYAARYGGGIDQLIRDQAKYPVGQLDHGRDRQEKRAKA